MLRMARNPTGSKVDGEDHTPVQRPAFRVILAIRPGVGRDRLGLTLALGGDPRRWYALGQQIAGDSLSAALG